jgi:hypothetical protein
MSILLEIHAAAPTLWKMHPTPITGIAVIAALASTIVVGACTFALRAIFILRR